MAEVSPAPQIPILVNYLFDIDPSTGGTILHAIIGDPTVPEGPFQTCTPQKSTNTFFGVAPGGVPLLTSPGLAGSITFSFTFTSRPDAAGQRHTQVVRVQAAVGRIATAAATATPLPRPTTAAAGTPAAGSLVFAPVTGNGPGGASRDREGPTALWLWLTGGLLLAAGIAVRRRTMPRTSC